MTRLAILFVVSGCVAGLGAAWHRVEARRRGPSSLPGIGVSDGWVVFSGPYCATCTQLVERLSGAGETVVEIDIDSRPDLVASHEVTTVPTVALLREGEIVAGAAGRRHSADLVTSHLRSLAKAV